MSKNLSIERDEEHHESWNKMNCVWDSEEVGLIPKCSAALTNAKNPLHYLNSRNKLCREDVLQFSREDWNSLMGSYHTPRQPLCRQSKPDVHISQGACASTGVWEYLASSILFSLKSWRRRLKQIQLILTTFNLRYFSLIIKVAFWNDYRNVSALHL